MAEGQLYTGGRAIQDGDYIMPKILLKPRTIENEFNGVKKVHTQLHKKWAGQGRFKHGTPYAPKNAQGQKVVVNTPNGHISLLIDCREAVATVVKSDDSDS